MSFIVVFFFSLSLTHILWYLILYSYNVRTIVDIYDGDTEPMIFHGKTLTSKVALRAICEAIAKYAFVTSPYPIVISAEIHCSLGQQELG